MAKASSVLERIRDLDAQKAKLMDEAKAAAIANAEAAIEELNELGFNYRLTEGGSSRSTTRVSSGGRRSGIRDEVLRAIVAAGPDGVKSAAVRKAIGIQDGDKSGAQSVANAISALKRGNMNPLQFDGEYEDRYLEIIGRYVSNRPHGERPADHFMHAYGELVLETMETQVDVLGELFMAQVSHGERGQYFTPSPICEMLVAIVGADGGTVSDPAGCGSGRMFIAAAKTAPDAVMHGVDVDQRCAMMATLNMILFNLNAHIVWGNGLTNEVHRTWTVHKGGYVTEH